MISADGKSILMNTGEGPNRFPVICHGTGGGEALEAHLKYRYGIEITGWSLGAATGISPDGKTIIGQGTNPGGNQEAWIISLKSDELSHPSNIRITD